MKQIILAGVLIFAACAKSPSQTEGAAGARAVADEYLKARVIKPAPGRVVVTDRDKTWEVVYVGPENSVGGPRVVEVDKRTMKATGTVASQ